LCAKLLRPQVLEETEHFHRWRQEQVAKIVLCGLPHDSFEALVPCVPNYCARKFWKKLSISIVGVKKKLRRLSSVGKHWQRRRETEKQGMNEKETCF
jgi:hypothetical protein